MLLPNTVLIGAQIDGYWAKGERHPSLKQSDARPHFFEVGP
jgi:hypothetical protein